MVSFFVSWPLLLDGGVNDFSKANQCNGINGSEFTIDVDEIIDDIQTFKSIPGLPEPVFTLAWFSCVHIISS